MKTYETEAIVIGNSNFGDANKIVTLFTADQGKVRGTAFGARRPKNALAAPLQMFHHIEVEIAEGYSLDTIKRAGIKKRYRKFGEDLNVLAYGMFVAEILCEVFAEKQAEPDVFELILNILDSFEERNPRITATAAAWQLLSKAGFSISTDICPVCYKRVKETDKALISIKAGGFLCERHEGIKDIIEINQDAKKTIEEFLKLDFKNSSICVKGSALMEVEKILLMYLQNILGYNLKSLKFIKDLGS